MPPPPVRIRGGGGKKLFHPSPSWPRPAFFRKGRGAILPRSPFVRDRSIYRSTPSPFWSQTFHILGNKETSNSSFLSRRLTSVTCTLCPLMDGFRFGYNAGLDYYFSFFFQLRLINSRLINSIISAERCVEKLRKEDFFFYFCFIYVAREVVKGQGF